ATLRVRSRTGRAGMACSIKSRASLVNRSTSASYPARAPARWAARASGTAGEPGHVLGERLGRQLKSLRPRQVGVEGGGEVGAGEGEAQRQGSLADDVAGVGAQEVRAEQAAAGRLRHQLDEAAVGAGDG